MSSPEHRAHHELPPTVSRRAFVGIGLAAGAGLACGVGRGSGCNTPAGPAQTAEVPLAELGEGAHRVVQVGGRPVDVVRRGDAVVALSLQCTHMGCVVRWTPEKDRFVCPCHHGHFDAEGRAVEGPPVRPLDPVPARIEGNVVRVG